MLASKSNITWDIIVENPQFNWNYHYVSMNKNITWEIVKNNPDKPWDYNCLLKHIFTKEKKLFYEKE